MCSYCGKFDPIRRKVSEDGWTKYVIYSTESTSSYTAVSDTESQSRNSSLKTALTTDEVDYYPAKK